MEVRSIPMLTLIIILLLVTQCISSDMDVIPDFLHLNNFGRYGKQQYCSKY